MSTPPAAVLRYLHASRLTPYKNRCGGSDYTALALHAWNAHLAAAFHQSLGAVEIILRNALDEALQDWNARQDDSPTGDSFDRSWLANPAAPLSVLVGSVDRDKLRRQAEQARSKRPKGHPRKWADIEHNDLLTQTSLGLWNGLLPHKRGNPRRHELANQLWSEACINAFPNLRNDPYGHGTGDRVRRLLALRNRVAHMENLLDVDIDNRFHDAQQLLTAIDGSLHSWFSGSSRVRSVANLRPHP